MPTYDLTCLACGRQWERVSTIAARYDPCETCGGAVEQRFEHSVQATPFAPYFDFALGEEVTSLGERWSKMKGETTCDGEIRRERLEYRDKPSPGDLSARADRAHEKRREEVRRGQRDPRDL